MFVSVRNCNIFEIVKQRFNVFTEISQQQHQYLGAGCIIDNGGISQFLGIMGAITKSFVGNNVRWEPKLRKISASHKRGIY